MVNTDMEPWAMCIFINCRTASWQKCCYICNFYSTFCF